MKKNDKQNQDNIIPFPGLEKRLYEKGLELMEVSEFGQAADILRQAAALLPSDAQVAVAYLVALYEYRDYEEAKNVAENLLHEGIGDYYDIIDIYLMILIQSGEHQQVIHTIESLFEEREVPPEKYEHLSSLLQLSKKVAENGSRKEEEDGALLELEGRSVHEQALIIGSLTDRNIRPYLNVLLRLLASEDSHPFIQTIALNVLREHGIDNKIRVKKLAYSGEIVPAELPGIPEMPSLKAVLARLNSALADENPVLLNQLGSMAARHFFLLYPFGPEEEEAPLWAAAYLAIGMELYGEDWDKEKLAEEYSVEPGQILAMIDHLNSLEQISSPIV